MADRFLINLIFISISTICMGQDGRNILNSIKSGGNCLLSWCDPNREYMPIGGWFVTHDTGRWWDAVLRVESVTDFSIPPQIEAGMLKNLDYFTANPDGLLLIPPGYKYGESPNLELHSMREALLAFTALIKYRNSNWARSRAQIFLDTIDHNLDDFGGVKTGNLKYSTLIAAKQNDMVPAEASKQETHNPRPVEFDENTMTTGRLLEAIVLYADLTKDPVAIRIAQRIAPPIFRQIITSDFRLRPEMTSGRHLGHTHSLMGTLKGLYLYGELMNDSKYTDAVRNVCRCDLVGKIILPSGLATHDLGGIKFKNSLGEPVGDMASTADYAQLAFWIGTRGRTPEFLDETEKIIRSRILPCQSAADDANYINPKTRYREIGGWCIHPYPHAGKGATLDVVAETLHCLTDIYTNMVVRRADGVWIYLTLDYESPLACVKISDSEKRLVIITPCVSENFFIRIPLWSSENSLHVKVAGRDHEYLKSGQFVFIQNKDIHPGSEIEITYDLPSKITKEKIRGSGRQFTFAWKGDRIESVYPNENIRDLPFYATGVPVENKPN
jgi:hypothetical protein